MNEDPKMVCLYVEALKDAYSRLKLRICSDFTGTVVGMDARIEPFAARLVREGGDPYAYMQYVFDNTREYSPDVYVSMFLSNKMMSRFLAERPEREQELRFIVEGQAVELKTKLRIGWELREILSDTSVPLSAVFRYAAAHSEGHADIAAQFESQATRMLIFEPYYKELLGKWLPERMQRV